MPEQNTGEEANETSEKENGNSMNTGEEESEASHRSERAQSSANNLVMIGRT
ncbi:hypothetical protein HanIR_Chr15g0741191 [Helianthus annuus]|nr:hypothetical protein HanIR_Chr15g0741191 [Helianthus annuus]